MLFNQKFEKKKNAKSKRRRGRETKNQLYGHSLNRTVVVNSIKAPPFKQYLNLKLEFVSKKKKKKWKIYEVILTKGLQQAFDYVFEKKKGITLRKRSKKL